MPLGDADRRRGCMRRHEQSEREGAVRAGSADTEINRGTATNEAVRALVFSALLQYQTFLRPKA
jgi:hypothetical protein